MSWVALISRCIARNWSKAIAQEIRKGLFKGVKDGLDQMRK